MTKEKDGPNEIPEGTYGKDCLALFLKRDQY
jgi:hypothetical protein